MGEQCERLRQEGIDKVIINLLRKGFSIDDISEVTERSKDDIINI